MKARVKKVLIGRKRIAARVRELARQITRDFAKENGQPKGAGHPPPEMTLVPILTGSIIFVSDLIRQVPIPMQIRLLSISSYPGASTTNRKARIRRQLTSLPKSLAGAHVLVLDDILDSGNTLAMVVRMLKRRKPLSVKTCVLLRKQRPAAMAFPVDYVGFDIPDEFVVGYGLDHDDYHRNLPEIVTLEV